MCAWRVYRGIRRVIPRRLDVFFFRMFSHCNQNLTEIHHVNPDCFVGLVDRAYVKFSFPEVGISVLVCAGFHQRLPEV